MGMAVGGRGGDKCGLAICEHFQASKMRNECLVPCFHWMTFTVPIFNTCHVQN